jgi:hypothetical protein
VTFANPLGLIGLLSLPLIIALHLIRERRRRFVVSSLGLWSFLDDQVRGPRPRRIPLTWLLLLDLIAAALFSFALARPRLQVSLPVFNARHLVIVLDVSTSMRARDGLDDRFSQAKAEAASLLVSAGRRDVVTLVAFGRAPQWIGDSRQEDAAALIGRIEALKAGETGDPRRGALQAALLLGEASLDRSLPAEFHILTDGAFSEDPTADVNGLGYPVHWHFFGRAQGNQAVLELNATPLGGNRYQVFTRIGNFDNRWVSRSVSLVADGKTLDTTRVSIPAESTLPQVWEVSGSYSSLSASLSGGDDLPEDDAAVIGLQPGGKVRVALVAEDPAPFEQALRAVPEVDLQVISPQDYTPEEDGHARDLTIFRGYLPPAWPQGPVLVAEPPEQAGSGADSNLQVRGTAPLPSNAPLQFPASDPLLAEVDFSGVRWSQVLTLSAIPGGFVALLQAGDVPILLRGEFQNQGSSPTQAWVLLADLQRGNFTKHPAFPIMMAKFALEANQSPLPASIQAGDPLRLPPPGAAQSLQVIPPDGSPAGFQQEWPSVWNETLDPGLYRVILEGAGGQSSETIVGVQAGDASESDLRPRSWTQAALGSENSAPTASPPAAMDPSAGKRPLDLLPWLMAAALVIMLVEAALAWR